MRIATIQFDVEDDPDQNVRRAERRICDAAAEGADLVILPEIWNVGYFSFDRYENAAESIDGPTTTRLRETAADLGIYLHGGSIIERRGDDLYNTSLFIGPDGELLDTYRKMHLFGYDSQETQLLTPGEHIVTVDTEFGTVGMTTCYDLRFPELYRALIEDGAELFLITSAWPNARLEHWILLNRIRALENQVFLAAANLGGEHAGVQLAGQSMVVDPWGIPIANAGTDDQTAFADIDLDDVDETREEFPAFHDRRPEL